jgi:hypothetical protein
MAFAFLWLAQTPIIRHATVTLGDGARTKSFAMKYLVLLLLAAALVAPVGCANIARPDWGNPGTADMQQLRAQQYDPYAEPDVGPNVSTGRPREFQKPLAEPLRAKWFRRGGDPRL